MPVSAFAKRRLLGDESESNVDRAQVEPPEPVNCHPERALAVSKDCCRSRASLQHPGIARFVHLFCVQKSAVQVFWSLQPAFCVQQPGMAVYKQVPIEQVPWVQGLPSSHCAFDWHGV